MASYYKSGQKNNSQKLKVKDKSRCQDINKSISKSNGNKSLRRTKNFHLGEKFKKFIPLKTIQEQVLIQV